MVRLLLVEDDELFALEVRRLLKEEKEIKLTKVGSAKEAERQLNVRRPDIMLIDVVLEDENAGIQLAQKADRMGIPFIFLTAFRDEDLFDRAKMTQPFNYLLKPFSGKELKNAIELALVHAEQKRADLQRSSALANNEHYIFVKGKQGQLEKISLSSIFLVEAFGNYCHVYAAQQRYTQRLSIKKFLETVPSEPFVQIHRNYVASIHFIDRVDPKNNEVIIQGLAYPLGQKFKGALLDMLPKI